MILRQFLQRIIRLILLPIKYWKCSYWICSKVTFFTISPPLNDLDDKHLIQSNSIERLKKRVNFAAVEEIYPTDQKEMTEGDSPYFVSNSMEMINLRSSSFIKIQPLILFLRKFTSCPVFLNKNNIKYVKKFLGVIITSVKGNAKGFDFV